jgi:GNAT superfamily N-acetyltransferase
MKTLDLNQKNIDNLTTFWSACGKKDILIPDGSVMHCSDFWPNRLWLNFDSELNSQRIEDLLKQANEERDNIVIPIWNDIDPSLHKLFVNAGFASSLKLEKMYLPHRSFNPFPECELTFTQVNNKESSHSWAKTAGDSFGYHIDNQVIEGLIGLQGFYVFLAKVNDRPVGTGMLLKTENIVGLHMIGVLPSQRRKGYARQIMHGLLSLAYELDCDYMTLQASTAGEPLYRQLGFERQGPIVGYKRIPKP